MRLVRLTSVSVATVVTRHLTSGAVSRPTHTNMGYSGFSTGKIFHKALAEALETVNPNAREDMKRIQAFVDEHTGFKCVSAGLDANKRLKLTLQAKP